MQEAAKKEKNRQKRTPTHPRNTGKTRGKHGKGNPPTQRKQTPPRRGEGKTRQGAPHPPREKQKSATRRGKEKPKARQNRWGEHLDERAAREEARAQHAEPRWAKQVVRRNIQKQQKNNTPELLSSVNPPNPRRPKRNSRCDDAPPPWVPETEKTRSLKGPKLKGLKNQDKSPKAPDLFKFPQHKAKTLHKMPNTQKHSFEKNTAGWRGPWAAPLLWRVAPGDLGTEEPELPHQGNRPRQRDSIQDSETGL